jgi:predicted  nucleic acid-binding Zn-ribbon protein
MQQLQNEINNLELIITSLRTENKQLHDQIEELRTSTGNSSPYMSDQVDGLGSQIKGRN